MFLGAPGSGKSTIGRNLAEEWGWQWISTGEILRASEEEWVIERLKTGQLFDDAMVMGLALPRVNAAENAIMDGFPRTVKQAEMLVDGGVKVDLMIEVIVPMEEIQDRLALRGREQDTPEIVEERVWQYEETKTEIMAYLAGHGVKVATIDGVGLPEEVYARAKMAIKEALSGAEAAK